MGSYCREIWIVVEGRATSSNSRCVLREMLPNFLMGWRRVWEKWKNKKWAEQWNQMPFIKLGVPYQMVVSFIKLGTLRNQVWEGSKEFLCEY